MEHRLIRHSYLFLTILLTVTFIGGLGLALFNTKGEPREAIVAVSMLQSGDWILPVSFGTDIPYKPPFLAWCIAVVSLLTGTVTEFTARFPSALAMVLLTLGVFGFFRRHLLGDKRSLLVTLVFMSSVEVFRAASACRVDMLLTAFTVGALFCLYGYRLRGYRGFPWFAILMMTGAVLTKGPVGMLIPCLVAWVFGLLMGDRWVRLTLSLAGIGVLACVIPAIWYYAAYREGGDGFLSLMLEENFGRFLGKMTYESHVNPWPYNVMTVCAGMLPYTLIGAMALFVVRYRRPRLQWRTWLGDIRRADPAKVFSVTATLVIFIFYCIPKSKRSVYLLPIYPFLAYFVTLLIVWLLRNRPSVMTIYSAVIFTAAVLAPAALPFLFHISTLGRILAVLCLGSGVWGWYGIAHRATGAYNFRMSLVSTFLLLWTATYGVLPAVLNAKSDRNVLPAVTAVCGTQGTVYQFIDEDMLRFYTLNFYMGDRIRRFEVEEPQSGRMLISRKDLEVWRQRYGDMWKTEKVIDLGHRSCDRKDDLLLVSFSMRDS